MVKPQNPVEIFNAFTQICVLIMKKTGTVLSFQDRNEG